MCNQRAIAMLSAALCCGVMSGAAAGETKSFDFKDPKGVNSVVFVLDSVLEPIMGVAQGVGGEVSFDPAAPKSIRGSITVEADEVKCALPAMTRVLQGEDWLNVYAHPTIEFSFESVKSVEKIDDTTTKLLVVGKMSLKGVTREITVPLTATYLAGAAGKRMRGAKGDLLVLRSRFTIKRSDFDIKPNMGPDTVAEDIELRISIVGLARK